jgi:hypothetical protein
MSQHADFFMVKSVQLPRPLAKLEDRPLPLLIQHNHSYTSHPVGVPLRAENENMPCCAGHITTILNAPYYNTHGTNISPNAVYSRHLLFLP